MLKNEVIYLHSLWHQGPPPHPPPQPPHNHHHLPPPQPPHHHHSLHPLNPPRFKKQRPYKQKRDPKKKLTQNSAQISTTEWPCPPSPPPKSPSWPSFKPTQLPSQAHVHVPSPKLQSWNQIQLKVVKEVAKFFKTNKNGSDNDDDDDDDDDEMEDDDSDDEEGGENGGYFGFFLKLFEENEELRSFYEKNYEDGEFSCLVCGGVGVIRRFKDCAALVQHSQTISKTKTIKAHRTFGQVVCKVLGWDVNKLPSIISFISEKKNETSSKLEDEKSQLQEKVTDDEVGDVGSGDKETGENEGDGAERLPDNCALAVAEEKLTDESGDKETIEREVDGVERLPDNCALAMAEGNNFTGEEKLPITDISNPAQNLQSVSGVGRCATDQLKETLDGEQENAESASNCVEPLKEEGSGKNESEDQKRSYSVVDRILMHL